LLAEEHQSEQAVRVSGHRRSFERAPVWRAGSVASRKLKRYLPMNEAD
jgi:hypothetical protein